MEKLSQIIWNIRKNKGISEDIELTRATRLREDLSFDSFDLAELTVNVEDVFGVDIFESGIVETLGDICDKLSTD